MHYSTAVAIAKTYEDVTYEEWCGLYINNKNPTQKQINTAVETAHLILVRNGAIEKSGRFDMTNREC